MYRFSRCPMDKDHDTVSPIPAENMELSFVIVCGTWLTSFDHAYMPNTSVKEWSNAYIYQSRKIRMT